MLQPSFIDFGFRPEFSFNSYTVRVLDDVFGSSAPDQLYAFQPRPQVGRGFAWFDLELWSSGTDFLQGIDLPENLDFSLTQVARGSVSYSEDGVRHENFFFNFDRIERIEIPEPSSLLLASAAILLLMAGSTLRKQKVRAAVAGVGRPSRKAQA